VCSRKYSVLVGSNSFYVGDKMIAPATHGRKCAAGAIYCEKALWARLLRDLPSARASDNARLC